ncbi:divergent CRAL/TRIO domain protein (macronuclear) [Tetrahymena thermophila SB210]|uniref:Divergent CRAL/TRIO domain protein n=1 Tax=Tetrahymena thermophila (strain SB210) TaxID=312017 RepID=Q22FY8_TETTS|nr:divergent CRAL/TRIO domain protein [Tetrahymena thermophila SB210]EAR84238.3 divergent CRAL/TRIO domain protein [Tetrahymena thermophila SB210]|eukprot:XP_001031901.3 divergent CRAL/TRIO domain protein [Tetrahymena thermophila SB210]
MVDVFYEKYNFLRVDPDLAQQVEHEESYIKLNNGGKKERNIFFNVSYDDEERNKIKEIENMAQQYQINHRLFSSTGQILKYIYANQMDPKQAFENIKQHIEWVENPQTFSENPLTMKHLRDGYIYIGGTDKKMRPTIIFNVDKIDLDNTTEESILPAYNRIFKIVEEYQFYKSKIETWNVIIETNEISAISLPIKILSKIISTMQTNFPSNLNRIFILNPSTSLNFTWNVIAAFINERSLKKISFLKKKEMSTLLQYYDADQLEQRFGGTAPNVTQYYPPQKFQPSQQYQQKKMQRKQSMRGGSRIEINGGSGEYQYRSTPQESLYQSVPNQQAFNYQLTLNSNQSQQNQQQDQLVLNQQNSNQTNYSSIQTYQHRQSKSIFAAQDQRFSQQGTLPPLYQSQPRASQQVQNTAQPQIQYRQSQYASQVVTPYQENMIQSRQVDIIQDQQRQSRSLTKSDAIQSQMRFTKQKPDNVNVIQVQPPGFRDEIASSTTPQQQPQSQAISKYSFINSIVQNERITEINRNFLDNMEQEEEQDVVKRSKKKQVVQDVQDPKIPDYMDHLREQNYQACSIF